MLKEELFEKAKHQPGDVHPKYPNLTWQQNKDGKWTWLTNKTNKKNSQEEQNSNLKNQPQQKPQKSEMPDVSNMTHQELVGWAKKTKEEALLSVVNSKSVPVNFRQIAYDELKSRNVDVSKIDITNIDTGFNGKKPKVKHGVKKEAITLTDEDYQQVSKVADKYSMDVTKFIAFIINQYYEGKENEQ